MLCFMFVYGLILRTALRKGLYIYIYIYERVLSVRLLMTEFDCPEVTLCG